MSIYIIYGFKNIHINKDQGKKRISCFINMKEFFIGTSV